MSALSDHLDRLFSWLKSTGLEPPSKDVRIVEVPSAGTSCVRHESLRKPLEYEARFEELIRATYPWLNMSCKGVHEGLLIVAIELPSYRLPREKCPVDFVTSVNLSGPASNVVDRDWRLDSYLTIE